MTSKRRLFKTPADALAPACRALLLLLAASSTRGGEVVEYYHLDAIGNVRAVTNAAGQVVERHDYLPFGEECTTGPCATNLALGSGQPREFTGKERDSETGLDYFGARYYGSNIGRFTTVDPAYTIQENLLDPQRWNRYAYARNNPLRYTDPDGRAPWDTVSGWFNAVSSNFFFGLGRMDAYHPDFAQGQAMGDKFSLGLSVVEMNVATGGGAVLALPSGGAVAIPAVAIGAHSVGQAASATFHLSKNSTLTPGEYAGESVPARGPQRDFSAGERAEVNRIGGDSGCHTCGTNQPGTKSGNFVPDHQPPNKVKKAGDPQRLYPHCINCSRQQGGEVSAAARKEQ